MIDGQGTNAAITNLGQAYLLNGCAVGNAVNQRVGTQITLRSLEVHAQVWANSTNTLDFPCRLAVVLDRVSNGAQVGAMTDIFATTDVDYATISPRNLVNRKRFKILCDKHYCLGGPAGQLGSVPCRRVFKIFMKFRRPIVVQFNNGNTGTYADIVANSLYLIFQGNATSHTNCVQTAFFYSRLRYTDM